MYKAKLQCIRVNIFIYEAPYIINLSVACNFYEMYDCKEFRFDKIQVRVYDNTSVVNIWFHQVASANGKDWSGDFLITDVWVKKGEYWQVVARHGSWLQNK